MHSNVKKTVSSLRLPKKTFFASKQNDMLETSTSQALEAIQKLESQQQSVRNSIAGLLNAFNENHNNKPVYERLNDIGMAKYIDKFIYSCISKYKQEMQRIHEQDAIVDSHKPYISKTAQKIKRTENIEDYLLKKNEEKKARIEEMRREKEQQDVSVQHFIYLLLAEYTAGTRN